MVLYVILNRWFGTLLYFYDFGNSGVFIQSFLNPNLSSVDFYIFLKIYIYIYFFNF